MIYEPLVRNTKDGIKPLLAKNGTFHLMVKHIRFIYGMMYLFMMVRNLMQMQ